MDSYTTVQREALLAAPWQANVLITGERAADMAEAARFIHDHSPRSTKGFATIKCSGIPDLLFESALFGHVQGSFAGASRDEPGLLEAVRGGTIFLDDVGGLSVTAQHRLLRFLEAGEYQRIGGNPVQLQPWLGVRVIASATANLQTSVAAGSFLHDLYLRLGVLRVSMPALHDQPAGGECQLFGRPGQGAASPVVVL